MPRRAAGLSVGRVLIPASKITARVRSLGRAITKHYRGRRPLVLGVMNGSLFFLADLLRAMETDVEIATVRLASYQGTKSSGRVRGLGSFRQSVKGRPVLIVDDILDTGCTLASLHRRLCDFGAVDVRICVLLAKRRRRDVPILADWTGFRIADQFVVGYGLDHEGQYRTLRDVHLAHPDVAV